MAKNKTIKRKIPPQKDLVKTVRGIWISLESHLDSVIPGEIKNKCPDCGGRKFHRDCVIEYAEMILTLSKLM